MKVKEMGEWDLVQLYQVTKLNDVIAQIETYREVLNKGSLLAQMMRDTQQDIRKAREQI